MNIVEIIDLARAATGDRSDTHLSVRINPTNSGMVHNWRRGKALPSDDNMLKLSELAGIKPEIGLIYLNIWRSGGSTRTTYRRLLKMLGVQVPSRTRPNNTKAGTRAEQVNI